MISFDSVKDTLDVTASFPVVLFLNSSWLLFASWFLTERGSVIFRAKLTQSSIEWGLLSELSLEPEAPPIGT